VQVLCSFIIRRIFRHLSRRQDASVQPPGCSGTAN
jgi:hypothetical protein